MIVACCRSSGIGMKNTIPWKLKPDMKRFKMLTKGDGNNAVIMGRNTWESLPEVNRPLPKRANIILSKTGVDLEAVPEEGGNVWVANNVDDVMGLALRLSWDKVWIIGGASIYEQFMYRQDLNKIYVTEVRAEFECDKMFPEIPEHFYPSETGEWNIMKYPPRLWYRYVTYINTNLDLNNYL